MAISSSIVPFASVHAAAFKALNLEWIRRHWEPEPADFETLDHPDRLLEAGGHIFIALLNQGIDEVVVGTCALLKMEGSSFELAKMAVTDRAQGSGIGRRLGEAVIAKARELHATRIYLESNTVLEPAIRLYDKLGFEPIKGPSSAYERCNIQMELML